MGEVGYGYYDNKAFIKIATGCIEIIMKALNKSSRNRGTVHWLKDNGKRFMRGI